MALLSRMCVKAKTKREDDIYVAGIAMRGSKGPAQLALSTAYSLNFWPLYHFMVIIKQPTSPPLLVFDFQPKDPENLYVALAALSGNYVPGVVNTRTLSKLLKSKCWFVGSSEMDAVEGAYEFNKSWQTDLRIGHHDCRDYTNGLVQYLTGEENVLERLGKSGWR
ncbi:hypothetical protein DCAR_0522551 [Daucus carota subsp. sativus]|uniref:Uncharacterized protein n=1 Tax=Daucus carota subsp. sativus TaxID=79200 RepID=A0AAF1B3Z4_DAUCS|nr:PREDICTED: uncharacterized protein LOC108203996 [Daucus carota subsp. sativus]WOH03157.1 hypothetical protein DCAR_0522551 [Daucus carota subsp. sativus]